MDGNFYGLTEGYTDPGTGEVTGGTAFQMTLAGVLTTLHTFNAEVESAVGASTPPPLTQGADGNFYGTTAPGGPNNDGGSVFRLTPAGAFSVVYVFPFTVTFDTNPYDPYEDTGYHLNGDGPAGVTQGADGNLYGITASGGSVNSAGVGTGTGTIFQLTLGGSLTTTYRFTIDGGSQGSGTLLQGSDGSFYGTTSSGGAAGTVFHVTPDGAVANLHNFDGTEGNAPSLGSRGGDGTLYGTTASGGPGNSDDGTVFALTVDGTLVTMDAFTGGNDSDPNPGLVLHPDGMIYGTTNGAFEATGEVYSFSPENGAEQVLHYFQGSPHGQNDGKQPQWGARLLQRWGAIFGTTQYGGTRGAGTVFAVDPYTGSYDLLHTFTGTGDGVNPTAGLTLGTDGNLYGTTSADIQASTPGNGTIFRISPTTGVLTTLHTLYGETTSGGTDNDGVIFRVALDPATVLPAVTLVAAIREVAAKSGQSGEFLLTLSHAYASNVEVAYLVEGTATPGTDYAALKGTVTVKAGATTGTIKVTLRGDLGGASEKTVVLRLESGGGYVLGTTGNVKVTIQAAQ